MLLKCGKEISGEKHHYTGLHTWALAIGVARGGAEGPGPPNQNTNYDKKV